MEEFIKLLTSNPESLKPLIKGFVEKYKPILYLVGSEFLEIAKDYAANKEIAKVSATIKKNKYDAYMEAGFTEEQAIVFIINDNLNLMDNLKKIRPSISNNSRSSK